MEKNNIHIDAADKNQLKQNALKYMPRNLSDTEAQRQILRMIAEAIPPVMSCVNQAETQIWPMVQKNALPVNQAVAQCAYQTDKIIESTFLENLALESLPEKTLLQAWIALDYYAYVLKAEYTVNIRNAQNCIANILLHGKNNSGVEDYGPTQPADKVDDYGPTMPADKVDDYGPTMPADKLDHYSNDQPTQVLNEFMDPKKQQNTQRKPAKKPEKSVNIFALAGIAVAVIALVVLGIIGAGSSSKIQSAIQAIDEIGKVTMESADRIEEAEKQVADLTDKQKDKVENLGELYDAKREYNRLTAAVQKASDAIDAIGTVTLDSGSKIQEARSAYDALKKDHLESYVSDKAAILTKAENDYDQCVSEDIYNTGVDYYDQGNYEKALEQFERILSDYPNTSAASDAGAAVAVCQIALAEEAFKDNDPYNAMKMLNAVDPEYQSASAYQDLLKKIKNSLASKRPSNGYVVDSTVDWGQCYVQIQAGDKDVCLKIENMDDPSKYKMVFIRAESSAKINVEDGDYIFKWAIGDCWFDKDLLFGDGTVYQQEDGYGMFTTEWNGNTVYFWYYELDLSSNSNDFIDITADQF